ncbi:two-component system response regulator [Deltaproteobacteria bacterium]|nr:two-component system response regulator [Deltaproteobacteria bacterium]
MTAVADKPTLLVVDDTPDNITLLCGLLGDQYKNKVATNGQKALQIAFAEPHPDLILLDIMMPGMDGYEVCRQLQANPVTKSIPVIFLTAKSQDEDETKGFELGAVDYITKPITPAILMARVQTHLALKKARAFLQEQNFILEDQVKQRTKQLEALQDALIISMASLAETRDNETGHHIHRTQHYILELAKKLAAHPKFAADLTPQYIELTYKTAPLHDIGKVGVPDRILLKPARLTPEEFEEMKRHTIYGRDTLDAAQKTLGSQETFLKTARDIAYHHHEKWDGSGYPTGISGENIPLCARLMAIADVYDALISRRPYKVPMSNEKAYSIIIEGKGTHFDPDAVDGFVEIADIVRKISLKFEDTTEQG